MPADKLKPWLWSILLVLLASFFLVSLAVLNSRWRLRRMLPEPLQLASGWQLQDAARVPQAGADLSRPGFKPEGWHDAVVPGTILTSLVNDGVYPEPLYGENNRPGTIPDSLCHTDWWYRTEFQVPAAYADRKVWLNFEGINYAAEVWVNGRRAGDIKGAFIRGLFDVTSLVTPGRQAALAVRVSPQPHPGVSNQHTIRNGIGKNGGITALDGPTFLCTIGWDWLAGVPDRDTGIWRGVSLSASGPVTIEDPAVTTDLPLPSLDSADITIRATLANHTDHVEQGLLRGQIVGDEGEPALLFQRAVTIPANSAVPISFLPRDVPQLHIDDPALWWPNGYGPQHLYHLFLILDAGDHRISDTRLVQFGIRKITYSVPGSDNLTISVNGVPIFCRGGDWGLDDALKRIPFARLDAQVRMHQIAHLNMIRNWVGQSTSEDFYDLCDRYGIMLWDECFQPNPADGPDPDDVPTYIANVRDKILRFRNHPSIALWCGRNEGAPPPGIDAALRKLMGDLDPLRRYQPSSTDGGGVRSGGPYNWRPPAQFYNGDEPFKTETGSVSIPTLESIQGMMPRKDWEVINDDWAQHDLARGAQAGNLYPGILAGRYGALANLADFARKGQLANYEAFRAMYEGRNTRLFHPFTGVITWMSHPAQPSFVWQLYHHDLEANSSLYAVQKACEPVHIQMNQANGNIEVINNLPTPLSGASARVRLFNLDGTLAADRTLPVSAPASLATSLGSIAWPATLSPVHFVKLELTGSGGVAISDNFYWHTAPSPRENFRDLETMPPVNIEVTATAREEGRGRFLNVTLHNPTPYIALMAHLQLRRAHSGARVLPAFCSENYVSLVPGEARTLTIEADDSGFAGEPAMISVDGWNVTVANTPGATLPLPNAAPSAAATPATEPGTVAQQVVIAFNLNAQPGQWPRTGLPIVPGPATH